MVNVTFPFVQAAVDKSMVGFPGAVLSMFVTLMDVSLTFPTAAVARYVYVPFWLTPKVALPATVVLSSGAGVYPLNTEPDSNFIQFNVAFPKRLPPFVYR